MFRSQYVKTGTLWLHSLLFWESYTVFFLVHNTKSGALVPGTIVSPVRRRWLHRYVNLIADTRQITTLLLATIGTMNALNGNCIRYSTSQSMVPQYLIWNRQHVRKNLYLVICNISRINHRSYKYRFRRTNNILDLRMGIAGLKDDS